MRRPSGSKPGRLRGAIVLLIYAGLLAMGYWGSGWLIDLIDIERFAPEHDGEARSYTLMTAGVLFYALLMAVPFVPGMEISLALLAVFGPPVAMPIYLATVAALTLSCLIGSRLPLSLIGRLFGAFGLKRSQQLVLLLQPLSAAQRLDLLLEHAPQRIVPLLLKHRYLAIIAALNMPGNALIGGGGGIALLAGSSGLYRLPLFSAAVALAALPIPLLVILSGG